MKSTVVDWKLVRRYGVAEPPRWVICSFAQFMISPGHDSVVYDLYRSILVSGSAVVVPFKCGRFCFLVLGLLPGRDATVPFGGEVFYCVAFFGRSF